MSKYDFIKQAAFEANLQLPKLNLVILTFGNVSAINRELGMFAIKPSGVSYDQLTPEKMVVVDLDGKIVEGSLRPSSDTKTHAVLYKHWSSIGGISHSHSTHATAWAQAQRDIPIYGTTHADYSTMNIPCTPPMSDEMIKGNYEHETGIQIINFFQKKNISHEELEMILIGSHGPFTWGKTAQKAVDNSAILESVAHMAQLTERINPEAATLNKSLIKKHFERKHGPDSYYGQ